MLEMLGIPCTGSDPLAIALTLDKALAKMWRRAQGSRRHRGLCTL